MFIFEMFEGAGRRVVVTYPGRFQPFHLGHADVFRSLQSRFGSDNVFIATSNKTDGEKSPFNFSDKLRFMHAAGVPDHNVIEVTKTYDLPDQFQADKENIIFITAVGAPDAQRLNPGSVKKNGEPSYFQKMPESLDQATTADKHGYVIIANERAKSITLGGKTVDVSHGTKARAAWNEIRNDAKLRSEYLKQMYGQDSAELGHILDKIPNGTTEPAPKPSPKLKKVKMPEGEVLTKDQLVDIYIAGMHKGNRIRKQVGKDIPNTLVNKFIDKVSKKFGIHPTAFVYGPSNTLSEEAAGVGVVRGGNDPRYSMATMGDQNDVTPDTLNQMMRGYNLIGKKGSGRMRPVTGNVGKGKMKIHEIDVNEGMYEYNRADPFDSEFAPSAGMGRMTLRGWKKSLARRLQEIASYAQEATQAGNIDKAFMWENIHKKMKNLNLEIIAEEIELAHRELENIRRQGGIRSRAFREKQMEIQQLEEGWKSKLAALGLAGAAALSPAPAQADAWDDIMQPVRKVQQVKRDIGNVQRNVEKDVSSVRNRVGRDLEQIPFFGVDQLGREIRGSTNHPKLQRDPAWDAKVQAAKEKREREQQERQWRNQQDRERYQSPQNQAPDNDDVTMNENTSGGTSAGAVATSMGGGNGFGQSIFYKQQPRKKKAKLK